MRIKLRGSSCVAFSLLATALQNCHNIAKYWYTRLELETVLNDM